jgi:hypothetical protein
MQAQCPGAAPTAVAMVGAGDGAPLLLTFSTVKVSVQWCWCHDSPAEFLANVGCNTKDPIEMKVCQELMTVCCLFSQDSGL